MYPSNEDDDILLENTMDDRVVDEGCDFDVSESQELDNVQDNKTITTRNKINVKVKKRSKDKSKNVSPWTCEICDKEFSGK